MTDLQELLGSSIYWSIFFRQNAEYRPMLPWDDSYQLTPTEREIIAPSIQQFELGERAQGRSFIARAEQYAKAAGDPVFVEGLKLFIQEENRHSRELRRFMEAQGIPQLSEYWSDGIFRKIRKLAGLELMVSVLVTAEVIAMSYYRALRGATESPLLKLICEGILRDEVWHLKYQGTTLAKLRRNYGPLRRRTHEALQYVFLLGTTAVVWMDHRRLYRRAGFTFSRFFKRAVRDQGLVVGYSRRTFFAQASQEPLQSLPFEAGQH